MDWTLSDVLSRENYTRPLYRGLPEVRSGKTLEMFGGYALTTEVRPCRLITNLLPAQGTEVLEAVAFLALAIRAIARRVDFAVVTESIVRPESLIAFRTAPHL